jgi:hypothetical protein
MDKDKLPLTQREKAFFFFGVATGIFVGVLTGYLITKKTA